MNKQTEAALKALQEAKCLEQEGQAFYQKAATRTKSAMGKGTFLSLARDEVMHERLIQRQIDSLSREGKWVELPEAEGATCDMSTPIFPQGRQGLKKAVKADTTDTEALLLALEMEAKSFDLYAREAKAATDAAARQMYEFLASQERTHFDVLMAKYEGMVHYGGWAN